MLVHQRVLLLGIEDSQRGVQKRSVGQNASFRHGLLDDFCRMSRWHSWFSSCGEAWPMIEMIPSQNNITLIWPTPWKKHAQQREEESNRHYYGIKTIYVLYILYICMYIHTINYIQIDVYVYIHIYICIYVPSWKNDLSIFFLRVSRGGSTWLSPARRGQRLGCHGGRVLSTAFSPNSEARQQRIPRWGETPNVLELRKSWNLGALTQGLLNVPFSVYWTSPYSSHYRPYT